MKRIFTITSTTTPGSILYEGAFPSLKACLEQAVAEHANLAGADLRFKNLAGVTLDDALMAGSDFTGANLCGANLSESHLEMSLFQNANLIDTCLSYAFMAGCDFSGARFGATDITGADLSSCLFEGLSSFSLDFMQASLLISARYRHHDGRDIPMHKPPRVLYGVLNTPVILLDKDMIIGQHSFPLSTLNPAPFLDYLTAQPAGTNLLT